VAVVWILGHVSGYVVALVAGYAVFVQTALAEIVRQFDTGELGSLYAE
jgi:hypothetical protein